MKVVTPTPTPRCDLQQARDSAVVRAPENPLQLQPQSPGVPRGATCQEPWRALHAQPGYPHRLPQAHAETQLAVLDSTPRGYLGLDFKKCGFGDPESWTVSWDAS